jgi:hypothetical protein
MSAMPRSTCQPLYDLYTCSSFQSPLRTSLLSPLHPVTTFTHCVIHSRHIRRVVLLQLHKRDVHASHIYKPCTPTNAVLEFLKPIVRLSLSRRIRIVV